MAAKSEEVPAEVLERARRLADVSDPDEKRRLARQYLEVARGGLRAATIFPASDPDGSRAMYFSIEAGWFELLLKELAASKRPGRRSEKAARVGAALVDDGYDITPAARAAFEIVERDVDTRSARAAIRAVLDNRTTPIAPPPPTYWRAQQYADRILDEALVSRDEEQLQRAREVSCAALTEAGVTAESAREYIALRMPAAIRELEARAADELPPCDTRVIHFEFTLTSAMRAPVEPPPSKKSSRVHRSRRVLH